MILYTMMPQELIFPANESEFGRQRLIMRDGIPLLVEKLEGSEYQVMRIMSTDPSHYLDTRYGPGTKILLN